MARPPQPRPEHGAERVVAWSAAGGLLTALALAALSGRLALDERDGSATTLGALGFSVAFAAPFVAALASFLARNEGLRRSVWLASGVLALCLGVLTVFGGVGLVFGVAGVGLVTAWWLARGQAGTSDQLLRSIALTGWLLVWLAGALGLLWLRETPACWSAAANGFGWVAGPSPTGNHCTSDIIDTTEGLLALVCATIGLAGMIPIVRGGNAGGAVARGLVPAPPGPTRRHSNGLPTPSTDVIRDRLG